jgi:hypothetical protein
LLLQQKQTLKEVRTKELSMEMINSFLQQCFTGPDGELIQAPTPEMLATGSNAHLNAPTVREKNLI